MENPWEKQLQDQKFSTERRTKILLIKEHDLVDSKILGSVENSVIFPSKTQKNGFKQGKIKNLLWKKMWRIGKTRILGQNRILSDSNFKVG